MPTSSASKVFALIDGQKNTTSTSSRGSRPSWALVGVGCSNHLQVAQGQDLVRVGALVQAAIGCCILHAPTSAQDCLDHLQFVLPASGCYVIYQKQSLETVGGLSV